MTEYVNKDYYNSIKGNCSYIDLNGQNIHSVMERLKAEGIMFSAAYGGYRNTVTVSKADSQRAFAIAAEYKTAPQNTQRKQRIIGNIEYSKIKDRNFINTDPNTALQVANLLSGDASIRFSGRILENSATITVSGRKNAEMVNRMIDNIRNADIINELYKAGYERLADTNGFVNIRNNASGEVVGFRSMDMVREMFGDASNEFFHPSAYRVDSIPEADEPFYISEVDSVTADERNVYVDENVTVPVFESRENAEQYAEEKGIDLTGFEEIIPDVPLEHFDDTAELSPSEQLKKRVNAELEAYITEMKSRSFDEIIEAAYRVTACKQINEYITNEEPDLTEAQLSALLSMDNILDEIYLEWVKNDSAESYDDVLMVMQDRADRILLSQQRENDPLEKAKGYISGYVGDVYGESAYFNNMKNITLDHFTVGRANKHTYNSEADLEAFTIRHRLDGTTVKTDTFDSLEQMNNRALSQLDYTNNTAMAERLCEDFERDLRTAQEKNTPADEVAEALNLAENNLTFSVVSIDDEEDFVIGGYADEDSIIEANEYTNFIDIHDTDSVTVRVDFYSVGNSELESEDMSEEQVNYVREHLDEVLKIATALDVRSFDIETEYEEIEEESAPLEKAIEYIKDFLEVEYGEAETDNAFKDLENVPLGYTSLGDDADHDFSVTANLVDYSISYTLDGVEVATEKYDSLEEMTEDALTCLDFDDMVTVGNEALEEIENKKFRLVIPEIDVDIDMRDIDSIAVQTPDDVLMFYYSSNNKTIERAWQSDDNSDTAVDIDDVAIDIRSAVSNGFAVEVYETAEERKMAEDNSVEIPENLTAIDDDTAVIMWEQGITVYHSGTEIPPMEENRENEHSIFENLSDDFYADREDVKAFRIADDIASEIWDMNRVFSNVPNEVGQPYYLSLESGGYDEWEDYNKGLNEYQNTLKALYTGTYTAVEDYLENIRSSDDVSEEMQEQAASLLDAVKSFRNLSGIEDRAEKENEPTYKIYQLKKGEEYHNLRFTRWDDMPRFNLSFDRKNYDEVYGGNIADVTKFPFKEGILEDIFKKFNLDRPEDFKGHSLSVSDVVVLNNSEGSSAHFVDTVGMADVTDLFFELKKETIDLSSLTELEITEEYDRRGDEPDNSTHVKNTILFTDLDKSEISRYKDFTYDNDVMPDSDEGYTTVTGQAMLDEINGYMDKSRKKSGISISVTDNDGNIKRLNGLLFEFTLGDRNVPVEHLEEKLAFETPDNGFISIFERDDEGYDYTVYDTGLNEIDGGVYDDSSISIRQALDIVAKDNGIDLEKCVQIDYDTLTNRVENKHNEVAIGDRYMLNGEEVKVVAFPGIMTDFLGEVEVENTAQEKFSVTSEELLDKAEFLGNDNPKRNTQNAFEMLDEYIEEQESKADAVPEKMPLYGKSIEEASELGERDKYFANMKENKRCEDAIVTAIANNYRNSRLDTDGVLSDVLKEFVFERVELVVAARLSNLSFDGRIDKSNVEWANGVLANFSENERKKLCADTHLNSHPGLINLFADRVRSEERSQVQKEQAAEKEAESYEPKLGDKFRDNSGEVWELTSLTGVMPWYNDQCAITSVSGNVSITKNENYSNLLDTAKYQRVADAPEAVKTADYSPKIGDLVELDGQVYAVADINSGVISLADTETLLGETRRMTLSEFFSSGFEVVEANGEETVSADVPLEHRGEKTNENVPVEHLEKSPETENVPVEHQKPKAENYVITDENLGVKTPKARFAANAAAIRTLNAIEAENRTATPDEQAVLSGYTGWGAIPNAFDPDNKDWSNEYAELKALLTDEEFIDARRSTLNAHFTSPVIIDAIYEGLANLGFEQGKILEEAVA